MGKIMYFTFQEKHSRGVSFNYILIASRKKSHTHVGKERKLGMYSLQQEGPGLTTLTARKQLLNTWCVHEIRTFVNGYD